MSPSPKVLRLPFLRRNGARKTLLLALVATVAAALGLGGSLLSSAAPSTYSLWAGTVVPQTPADPEQAAVELGTRFTTSQAGQVTAIRFYKSATNTGTHTGSLWDASGRRLATVTFTGESQSGWQQAKLATPVNVQASATYVVSYTGSGHYSDDQNYFAGGANHKSGPLTATAGLYTYGTGYPVNQWRASNYYVDVVLSVNGATSSTTSTRPPTSTTSSTSSTSTNPPTTTTSTRPPTTTTSTKPPTSSTSTKPPTSTTSSSSTTPPVVAAANCVGAANTPGGPDPWGGCWPGPQNTGYPHGLPGDTRKPVTLTTYTGPTTITSCGVVIDSKIVNQTILIQAGNGTTSSATPCVTIKNSLVKGVIFAEQSNYGPTLVQDTEIAPPDLPWWENLGRSNVFAYRVNSHGGEGVIKCDTNCEAKDNWVHGMNLGGVYHYNAFGGNGTNNFRIEHNYASCGDWSVTSSPGGDAGCSAVIGFYGDYGPIQNLTINRNYLASTFDVSSAGINRQAGYCLNPGYYPGKPYPDTKNISVTENVFARGGSGKC